MAFSTFRLNLQMKPSTKSSRSSRNVISKVCQPQRGKTTHATLQTKRALHISKEKFPACKSKAKSGILVCKNARWRHIIPKDKYSSSTRLSSVSQRCHNTSRTSMGTKKQRHSKRHSTRWWWRFIKSEFHLLQLQPKRAFCQRLQTLEESMIFFSSTRPFWSRLQNQKRRATWGSA